MMEILQWHIIGLQETYFPQDALFVAQDFVCIQAASDRGPHGVVLWIRRSWPSPGLLQAQQFTVLRSSPRLLLMRCYAPGINMDSCVAHSPWRDQGDSVSCQWWNGLKTTLTARSNDHYPLILMVDANARVGGVEGHHIGAHQGHVTLTSMA